MRIYVYLQRLSETSPAIQYLIQIGQQVLTVSAGGQIQIDNQWLVVTQADNPPYWKRIWP